MASKIALAMGIQTAGGEENIEKLHQLLTCLAPGTPLVLIFYGELHGLVVMSWGPGNVGLGGQPLPSINSAYYGRGGRNLW